MSRCFPFPPPGYEQKASDCVELPTTKEKHKSKRDKKEKREKDKKEGKEKKHKDKNKEKHGEKKDRKDRDRDKDKDRNKKKEKDKSKDKGSTSNDRIPEERPVTIVEGKTEIRNLHDSKFRDELQSRIRDEKGAGRNQMVEAMLVKAQGKEDGMLEKARGMVQGMAYSPMDRRKQTNTEGTGILQGHRMVNSIVPGSVTGSIGMEQRNRMGSFSSAEKGGTAETKNQFRSSNSFPEKDAIMDQKNRNSSSSFYPDKDSKIQQRNRSVPSSFHSDKDGIMERRNANTSPGFFPEKDATMEQRNRIVSSGYFPDKDAAMERRNPPAFFQEKDAISEQKNRGVSSGLFPAKETVSEQKNRHASGFFPEKDALLEEKNRFGSNEFFTGKDSNVEQRVQTVSSGFLPGKDANKKTNGKEKISVQGVSPQKMEKHKSKEKSKTKDGKERHKDKEKKKEKEDKKIEKGDKKEKDKKDKDGKHIPESIKNGLQLSTRPALSSKEVEKNVNVVGLSLKRKEINGFLHDNEVRPVKLQRTSSPHPQIQNGRNLAYNHVNMPHELENKDQNLREPSMPDKIDATSDRKAIIAESMDPKANGAVQHQTDPSTSLKPLKVDSGGTINKEIVKKPPHPDTKYLNQILSVPKMAEWPEVDDQEWLFGHGDYMQPEHKKEAEPEPDDVQLVWAKTLKIEGEDIVALPYVIPY